ncbi:MAG TPA: cation:proton antiporter [Bryobacteraceae bacterium]|nr:cation:proton antiporter [Bryobacteraceae bacterium]
MTSFNPELFLSTLALIGAVIVISALLSGLVEKSGLPQVAVFLGLGAAIGPAGLNLIDVDLHSPILRVVGTLSLVLVLFTDALSLNLSEVRKHRFLSFLVLGPGTLFSAVLIALLSWWLLGVSPGAALILGAALASTDPVMLRGLLKRPGLNPAVRQALRLEGGMNDAVLLPIVLVGMTFLGHGHSPEASEWGRLGMDILVLSPAAGIIVGLAAVGMLELVRKRIGVRRDYESIYSLGVAFAAFAAAESVHGSGFLAAFAAGLTISAVDVELCDCFLEYGETTAEMALMFTFVLFGMSVIWKGVDIVGIGTLLFVGGVFIARPAAFIPALLPARLSWKNRALISWFGPRGLSSLLLVLLPVFAGLPQAESLVTLCCLVVLFSVVLHGLSPSLLVKPPRDSQPPRKLESPENTLSVSDFERDQVETVPGSGEPHQQCSLSGGECGAMPSAQEPIHPEYISIAEVRALETRPGQVVIVDARTERTYDDSDESIPGSVRVSPEHSVRTATQLSIPKGAVLAVLCA